MSRPVVYYAVSLFIGCFSCLWFLNNMFIGAVITASFLFTIFLTVERRFSVLISIFFIIGMTSFFLYFNIKSEKLNCIKVRINDKNLYNAVASFNGRNIILEGNFKDMNPGELVVLKGIFEKKADYEKGVVGTFKVDSCKKCGKDFIYKLYQFKKYIYSRFLCKLGEENTSQIMALCFGDTSYLTDDQNAQFKQLGIIHAVSVSGFHMAIIFKLLENLTGIYGAVSVSFIYVIFTGASAATVRSFIMIVLYKISKKLYRNYDALCSLSFTTAVILLIKPYYILNLGFILSCLATFGIILFYNPVRRAFYRLPEMLNDSLSISFSAQIFAAPYAAMTFNTFSSGFIAGNLILLPLYSAVVLVGNIALAAVWIPSVPVFDAICFVLSKIMMAVSGAMFLLMKITPETSFISLPDCFFMMGTFICYILNNHGFKKARYIPLILFLLSALQYYSLFPEIQFQSIGKSKVVVIKYREKSILICDSNSKKTLQAARQKNFINRTVIYDEDGVMIGFDKKHILTVPKETEDSDSETGRLISGREVIFKNGNKNFVFVQNKKELSSNTNFVNNYDIINLPEGRDSGSYTYYNQEIYTYYIVFNKILYFKN